MMHIPEQDKQRLQHIATQIENGNIAEAKSLLADLQRTSPPSAPAWLLVSYVADTQVEQFQALNHALALAPNYQPAKNRLEELRAAQAQNKAQLWERETTEPRQPLRRVALRTLIGLVFVILVTGGLATLGMLATSLFKPPTSTAFAPETRLPPRTTTSRPTAFPVPQETALPAPLAPTIVSGQMDAFLNSVNGDPLGNGQGDFTLKGTANVVFEDDTLKIMISDQTHPSFSTPWEFWFYAPNFQSSTPYSEATGLSNPQPNKPRIYASRVGKVCTGNISGKFIVEQQQPNLIISFTHFCNGYALRGVLQISPSAIASDLPPALSQKVSLVENTTGDARVEMTAASGELMSGGRSSITLVGLGSYNNIDANTFQLNVTDDYTGERWLFQFDATDFLANHRYIFNHSSSNNTQRDTGLSIINLTTAKQKCTQVNGEFSFEQQGGTLRINFTQRCDDDPRQQLQGTIQFRPKFVMSPTPALSENDMLVPVSYENGRLHIEVYSAPDDPIGEGRINLVFDFEHNNPAASIHWYQDGLGVNVEWGSRDNWQLLFWSPVMQISKTYQVAQSESAVFSRLPLMRITHELKVCPTITGHFTVEQKAPTIIISFEQICNNDPKQLLRGRLTFIPPDPNATRTPTPTASATMNSFSAAVNGVRTGSVDVALNWTTTGQTYARTEVSTAWSNAQQGIVLIIPGAPTSWVFRFYAPTYLENKRYEHVPIFSLRNKSTPGMSIVGSDNERCQDIDGTFKIHRNGEVNHGTVLVIEFSQICKSDPAWNLQGTIRFTPN